MLPDRLLLYGLFEGRDSVQLFEENISTFLTLERLRVQHSDTNNAAP
jgi:hypothetical protein